MPELLRVVVHLTSGASVTFCAYDEAANEEHREMLHEWTFLRPTETGRRIRFVDLNAVVLVTVEPITRAAAANLHLITKEEPDGGGEAA